jgi:hypothetical protein
MQETVSTAIDIDKLAAAMTVAWPDKLHEVYQIDKAPTAGSTLVVAAKRELSRKLDANAFISRLHRFSELFELAYCSVAGIRGPWDAIAEHLSASVFLYGNCVSVAEKLEQTGRRIAGNGAEAFHWLIKGQDKRGLEVLARSAREAAKMAPEAQKMADAFGAAAVWAEDIAALLPRGEGLGLPTPVVTQIRQLCAQMPALARHQKQFWENVKAACGRPASSDIESKVEEELKSEQDPKARIDHYLSEMFMRSAIEYLARGVALMELGRELKEGSIKARDELVASVNAAPTLEQARALVEPLIGRITSEPASDRQDCETPSGNSEAATALLRVTEATPARQVTP